MKSHYYKALVIPAVILLLMIAGNYFTMSTLSNNSNEMISQIDQIKSSVNNKDWEQAKAACDNLNTTWEKFKPSWAAMISHNEMDVIDQALSKIEVFVIDKNYTFCLAELATLKKLYAHIPESEKLNITNIL